MELTEADCRKIEKYVRSQGLMGKFAARRAFVASTLGDWDKATEQVCEEFAERYFPDRLWDEEHLELESKSSRFREDVEWVYRHFSTKGLRAKLAPSTGAWGLYEWAQENRNKFFGDLVPRYMAKYQEAQEAERGGKSTAVEKLIEEMRGEDRGEEHVCPACGARF